MDERCKTARVAGLLYLIVVICGTLYLQYIPARIRLINPNLTYPENIVHSLVLFKSGIAAEIICWISFLILALMFYRLLKPINEVMAKMMVTFAAVQVPIAFANLTNKLSILTSIGNILPSQEGHADKVYAQIKWSLDLYQNENQLNHIFWGLWLFPLGYLITKSRFIPKMIGYVLIIGCLGYLVDFFGTLFSTAYIKSIVSDYMTLPAGIGEISICIFLLIAGIKQPKTQPLPN